MQLGRVILFVPMVMNKMTESGKKKKKPMCTILATLTCQLTQYLLIFSYFIDYVVCISIKSEIRRV